jgi:hypothetical protein
MRWGELISTLAVLPFISGSVLLPWAGSSMAVPRTLGIYALAAALAGAASCASSSQPPIAHLDLSAISSINILEQGIAAYDRNDYAEALRLLKPLAQHGKPRAQLYVGLIYLDGLGVPPDASEAVNWFREAARQRDIEAEYNLGLALYEGKGVALDYRQSAEWFETAAKQGYGPAAYNLGTMYEGGIGVSKDANQALAWYGTAAAEHLPEAMHELGSIYWSGRLGPRDPITAYAWLVLATQNGDHDATSDADEVGQALSPDQREKALSRASQWQEDNTGGTLAPIVR